MTAGGEATFRSHILVISDRAFRGERPDRTAPILRDALEAAGCAVPEPGTTFLPDERALIAARLADLAADPAGWLVVTTGGTGAAPRDVTPEATRDVVERELPGFGELMRAESLKSTIHAVVSRAIAGTRGRTLVVNLPGSPTGALECLRAVLRPSLHVLALLRGASLDCAPPAAGGPGSPGRC